MCRKNFKEVIEAFIEETGIELSAKDMARCEALYKAEANMLADQKRTRPTRQNYGIYVERLPEDMRFSHATIDNNENVSAFADYLIGLRKDRRLPESQSEIDRLKKENASLKKAMKEISVTVAHSDIITQRLIEINKENESYRYRILRLEDFIRSLGYNPKMLPDVAEYQKQPSAMFIWLSVSNSWVDTRTGEVISDDHKKELERILEQNNRQDVDVQ